MRKLALTLATCALVLAPATAADAKPRIDPGCIVAAFEARDLRAVVACFDDEPVPPVTTQRIDWD